jgi:HK97 family phage major capsid protein
MCLRVCLRANRKQKRERETNKMSKEKRAGIISRAESILERKPLTHEDTALFNSLMKLSDAMLVESESSVDEQRKASLRFREVLSGSREFRTYSPLATGADGQIIAAAFEDKIKSLMISAGPLYAGSPALSNFYADNNKMQPTKFPVCDDTASTGFVLTENTGAGADEAEINFSGVSFGGGKFFSTGVILVSTSLVEDLSSWSTTEALVQKTASQRLSRIMNSTWLPLLKTALAANSSAPVAAAGSSPVTADVYTLVASVEPSYKASPNAGFLMSRAMQNTLGQLILTGSYLQAFKHVLDAQPTLLGYPVFVSSGASSTDLIFGDLSYAYSKSTPLQLKTLNERFVLDGYIGLLLGKRADFQWSVSTTSDSPVKYLTFS